MSDTGKQATGQIVEPGVGYSSLINSLREQPNYLMQKFNQKVQAEKQEKQEIASLPSRRTGVYIPPHKLRQMQEQMMKADPNSVQHQRMMWELLRKSINGIVNKVNISNIENIVIQLFNQNILRGKGLLARAIIKAQMASPNFTHVYAALIAVLNTKLPQIGNLIIKRVMLQFKRSFHRNNKIVCIATTKMIAHLINQRILGQYAGLQLLFILLGHPSNDSVQIACDFMIEVGQVLSQISPAGSNAIFERFKSLLHQAQEVDQKAQYSIQKLFAVRKTGFKQNPGVIPQLDLVELQDQITHNMDFQQQLDPQQKLNTFKQDPFYQKTQAQWDQIKRQILGEENIINLKKMRNYEEELQMEMQEEEQNQNQGIQDLTEADLVNLRRTIYLAIQSTVNFQECAHKILKMNIAKGYEMQLVDMIIQCCMMERIYQKFFGLLAERFCNIDDMYKELFIKAFINHYNNIFKQEANKIRNIAKLFGHLFYNNAIDWKVFQIVRLTPDATTAAGRMFLKIIFRQIGENMGIDAMAQRFKADQMRQYFQGLFPIDNPTNIRFAINYFTAIGLGKLTQELRQVLALQQQIISDRKAQQQEKRLQELMKEEQQLLKLIQQEQKAKQEQYQKLQKQRIQKEQRIREKERQRQKQKLQRERQRQREKRKEAQRKKQLQQQRQKQKQRKRQQQRKQKQKRQRQRQKQRQRQRQKQKQKRKQLEKKRQQEIRKKKSRSRSRQKNRRRKAESSSSSESQRNTRKKTKRDISNNQTGHGRRTKKRNSSSQSSSSSQSQSDSSPVVVTKKAQKNVKSRSDSSSVISQEDGNQSSSISSSSQSQNENDDSSNVDSVSSNSQR